MKVIRIVKILSFLRYVIAIVFVLFLLSGINYAKIIHVDSKSTLPNINQNEVAYTFKIKDKLNGKGEISISIQEGQVKGLANGIGMTAQCNVDFQTNIQGKVNELNNSISINVIGKGDPLGILIPGVVTFEGPLNGFVEKKKLTLTGKVNINGSLAKLAGFKKVEEIEIEIPLLPI